MERLLVAVVQITSTTDLEANLQATERTVRRAASRGARLVLVPENFAFIGDGTPASDQRRMEIAESLPVTTASEASPVPRGSGPAGGPILERMARLAVETHTCLVLGAMPERVPGETARACNTQVVLSPEGKVLACYRKIHLFDVSFADGPTFRESKSIVPGADPVLALLPEVKLGLTICYDLRFPELFRRLALDGAEAFTVPAAFTLHTGKDHWEPLLRARAIENTAYVLAAAQWGSHGAGRASWGKSMIVDPWGEVIAQASEGEGIAVAELDPELLRRTREGLPTLSHVKLPVG